jgi:hypothetical protein
MKPNLYRNHIIHKLWEDGNTIDEISFETNIPRSTVGYYIRKFNKCAKKGEPIAHPLVKEEIEEKDVALRAFAKVLMSQKMLEMMKEPEGVDRLYKILMIYKLMKELKGDIFITKEEAQVALGNFSYIIKQISASDKSTPGS